MFFMFLCFVGQHYVTYLSVLLFLKIEVLKNRFIYVFTNFIIFLLKYFIVKIEKTV